MFENSGKKLMGFSKVYCIVQIVLYGILGVLFIVLGVSEDDIGSVLAGFIVLIFGAISSWFINLIAYAFGELVEIIRQKAVDDNDAAKNIREINEKLDELTCGEKGWFCTECGAKNRAEAAFCKECGNKK